MCPAAWACPDTYPPFPASKPAPYPTLEAEPIIGYDDPASFTDGQLHIETERVSPDQVTTRVSVGERVWLDTAKASQGMPSPMGSRVYYTDLTGDGHNDVLIYAWPGSNGLGGNIEIADVLIRQPDGGFAHDSFEVFSADPKDFIDVNADGRYEMLWVNFYQTGGHSYWVYRVVEIGDTGLRLNDQLIQGFPKIIWFTEKPNDQPTQRLTVAEREDLIQQSTARWQGTDQ